MLMKPHIDILPRSIDEKKKRNWLVAAWIRLLSGTLSLSAQGPSNEYRKWTLYLLPMLYSSGQIYSQ